MNLSKYLTDNKFGLLIDLRSMADTSLHGNGVGLVNTWRYLEVGNLSCHLPAAANQELCLCWV